MTQPENAAETFPLIPILVLFGSLVLVLVLVFGISGGGESGGEAVAVAPTETEAVVNPTSGPTATPTEIPPRVTATPQAVAVADSAALDPQMVSAGEATYQTICTACHGFNARGIPGLGKTLIGSEFVNSQTDDELHAFLLVGRAVGDPLNTTGVAMPAKGGNPMLTDADMYNVIAYIRSLNTSTTTVAAEPTAVPTESGPRPTATEFIPPAQLLFGSDATEEPTEGTQEPVAVAAAPTTAPAAVTTFALPGASDYIRACAGCHGIDGEGVPMIAVPLSDSD
ncbi:MAG: cytochrome c, partial [Anaerolineae bacterium]|nr:cytochrome c [Anaerolineae bacterium]